jgi:hypothetical protein
MDVGGTAWMQWEVVMKHEAIYTWIGTSALELWITRLARTIDGRNSSRWLPAVSLPWRCSPSSTAAEPNDSTHCGTLSGVLDVETPNREQILPFLCPDSRGR